MAGTNAHAAKAALLTLMQAAVGYAGVQVLYSYPGLSHEMRETIYFDSEIGGSVELVSMRGGQALKRGEELTTTLVIEVQKPGSTRADNEARACALGTIFEGVIATNPDLGSLSNMKLARISSFTMTSWADDECEYTRVLYGVRFTSHNT